MSIHVSPKHADCKGAGRRPHGELAVQALPNDTFGPSKKNTNMANKLDVDFMDHSAHVTPDVGKDPERPNLLLICCDHLRAD